MTFLTDPNAICTTYVKLELKDVLFHENFLIFGIFIEKIIIYYKITSVVQFPYTSPPIPFGLPIRVSSVRNTSFTYLRILFEQKKIIIFFTHIGENQVDPHT